MLNCILQTKHSLKDNRLRNNKQQDKQSNKCFAANNADYFTTAAVHKKFSKIDGVNIF